MGKLLRLNLKIKKKPIKKSLKVFLAHKLSAFIINANFILLKLQAFCTFQTILSEDVVFQKCCVSLRDHISPLSFRHKFLQVYTTGQKLLLPVLTNTTCYLICSPGLMTPLCLIQPLRVRTLCWARTAIKITIQGVSTLHCCCFAIKSTTSLTAMKLPFCSSLAQSRHLHRINSREGKKTALVICKNIGMLYYK